MGIGDWVRGSYVRSPWWLKRLAAPVLAAVPLRFRFGRRYWRLRQEISRSEADPDFVAAYQQRCLQQLIRVCIAGSRYYRQLLGEIFDRLPEPHRFDLDALRRLPVLQKDVVRDRTEDFLAVPAGRADLVSTSGSSGEPLKFYLDRDRSPKEWAFINHIWSRIGFQPRDRRAVLRGVLIRHADVKPWEFDPALGELRLSAFHLVPEVMDLYLGLMTRFQVSFIHGYPSAIAIVAAHAIKTGWRPPATLRGVLPISETLFPHQRELIQQAFGGAAVMPLYGLSEKVAIAGEVVGEPEVYEFEPLYGFTELVDDAGVPVETPGREGRIVGTGFISTAMPLLRYETGDRGVLVAAPAPANGYRLRVRGIRSRWGQEFLIGRNGARISIAAINIHSAAYGSILAFQFYQDTAGEAVVRAVPRTGRGAADIEPFVREVQEKVGANLRLGLELAERLETNERGKRPFVDQRLPEV